MAKDNEEKIGAMSQQNCHGLKYKYPLKNYRVHEMPTGDQLPPHYIGLLTFDATIFSNIHNIRDLMYNVVNNCFYLYSYDMKSIL